MRSLTIFNPGAGVNIPLGWFSPASLEYSEQQEHLKMNVAPDRTIISGLQGVPKKCTNRTKWKPKLSAAGLNLTMTMTWEGLIRLSLSKKRLKNYFSDTCRIGICQKIFTLLNFSGKEFYTLKTRKLRLYLPVKNSENASSIYNRNVLCVCHEKWALCPTEPSRTFRNLLEPSGTFQNLLEPSGTF